MSIDAMKQALEALEDAVSAWRAEMEFRSCIDAAEPWAKAAESLRAAIPLMSIDVMKQALAVLDDYEPNEAHKVATALRAAIPHSEDCWRWHHECAAIRMERIFNES